MFQRIKASIDSALEQEQAKARALHGSPTRSGSGARRVASRAISPQKKTARPSSRGRQDGNVRDSDPADFEAEFVIDDDVPSRSGTPKSAQDLNEKGAVDGVSAGSMGHYRERDGEEAETTFELPTDVRVKLRKLEKLEGRYQELLRSYRMAHARVQTIDAFETSLRENTPLTSISDPKSLVEYLNQVNLKGDMVLDELKRVSNQRDSFKQRLAEAERTTKEAWDEVVKMRSDKSVDDSTAEGNLAEEKAVQHEIETQEAEEGSPLGATKKSSMESNRSPTIKIPKMTLFSPKLKSLASPKSRQGSEDLFSYDGEIPRLEGALQTKQAEIESLQTDVQKLRTDLTVTRESTQSMVQTLEEATREVNALRDSRDRSAADSAVLENASDKLRSDLQAAETRLHEIEGSRAVADREHVRGLNQKLETLEAELTKHRETSDQQGQKAKEVEELQHMLSELEAQLSRAKNECELRKQQVKGYQETIDSLRSDLQEAQAKNHGAAPNLAVPSKPMAGLLNAVKKDEAPIADSIQVAQDAPSTSKKKNKKKKKGPKSGGEPVQDNQEPAESVGTGDFIPSSAPEGRGTTTIDKLQIELQQLQSLLNEKDNAIDKIASKLKDQDGLNEEIETLRDDLITVGQEHVEAKDKIKDLLAEKRGLKEIVSRLEAKLAEVQGSHETASAGSEQRHKDLSSQFEELKVKTSTLQIDLSAAQQLASSRFKDLENLKSVLHKAQPEINTLRSEAAEMKATKEALAKRDAEFKQMDSRHEEMRSEVAKLKQTISSREAEIRLLNQFNAQETNGKAKAEEESIKASQDVTRLEIEKKQAIESLDRLGRELEKIREDLANHKARLRDVEQQYSKHRNESAGLKEEMELKSAQYASAQSLMASMRDQTAEMAIQMKEARDRCESLEEENVDAHRLLSERSREGETMRRLLADIESRADSQTRSMKERMDAAIEERDRAEEDASTSGRRRARDLEDLRNKYRDLERSLKRAEEDKEELELAQRDWKRRREELEYRAGQSTSEADEVRKAMGDLRDALDESERQGRELEKQKAELRRSVEETQLRLEKLQKSNRSMSDEISRIRESRKASESETQSSRPSIELSARTASPIPPGRSALGAREGSVNGQASAQMDYVYLKNVLLQFLEQKDKKHQMQLIPVLGMLLHFDRRDEQRWMSAIATKA